ncbi:exosortase N [Chitinophaga sp. SYP-B3965]|uniref:exosortase N n=1 Tax=Chitinophaga sp. SYP-B3965 TaxID=2663120 RepID=UPI001299E99B|nr:exosortase N [Chitinophaga sp. SYP-B3965]MRG44587.1 exosortase N [Chitinophaga sp. SYP-B3965]
MDQSKRMIPAILGAGLIAGIYVLIVQYALKDYIAWRSPGFLLGLVAIPIVLNRDPLQKKSLRFYYAALLCCILAWILPVKTLLYASVVMGICFLIDNVLGKINLLPVLAMVLMAPICDYITNIFTFPIRLQLTAWAGTLLQISGVAANVEGNTIFFEGNEFSVDAACMGLNMMITSMLCGIMILGFYQKKMNVRLNFFKVTVLMGIIALLNIIANLFRMILLVMFVILPEDAMHGYTGIMCLAVYVILPLIWLIPWLVKHWGKIKTETAPAEPVNSLQVIMAHVCLAACVGMVAWKTMLPGIQQVNPAVLPAVEGFKVTSMDNNVIKVENDTALIYVKTIPGFYYSDHHPTICWRGSGFEFKHIKEEKIAGKTISTSILQKGTERLYTAWWYDNGTKQTGSQLDWRWDALIHRTRYAIVNVSTENRETLEKEVARLLQPEQNIVTALLH